MPGITRACLAGVAVVTFLVMASAHADQNEWQQIDLEGPIEAVLPDGSTRILEPSCSGGPELVGGGVVPGSTDYYFFVQQGDPDRLLFMLDGDGACWDALTCIGSALAGIATYDVSLDETAADLAEEDGIFDSNNPETPYKDYTKVFVPYCSADIHWGSRDTIYQLPGQLPWTIHHRGADNFLAALDWLQKNGREQYGIDFKRARNVTVAGASAGGYGASLAFAYVAELLGEKARLHLISDAAIGVINEDFYTTAIYNPDDPGSENWGVANNLPSWVPGMDEGLLAQGAAFPRGFVPSVFTTLPNYRFFIDDGTFHTFAAEDQYFYEVGANGISVADWITAMLKPGSPGWDSLDAGPPF